ncbi:MAG: hypothetical protein V4585_01860 [Bacteroidota bacterium]
MDITPQMVRIALVKKGIPAYKMCEDIKYSQASLNNFYNTGNIRESNKNKIIEYLGIQDEKEGVKFNKIEVNVLPESKIMNERGIDNSVSDSFIDRLLMKIEKQAIEIFTLKSQLGKFRGTSLTLTT